MEFVHIQNLLSCVAERRGDSIVSVYDNKKSERLL